MSETKKRYIKVGTVLDKGKGPFIVLGNANAKDPKYKFDTQIRVTTGTDVVTKKNIILNLKDPRKNNKYADKVPDMVQYEIILIEEEQV